MRITSNKSSSHISDSSFPLSIERLDGDEAVPRITHRAEVRGLSKGIWRTWARWADLTAGGARLRENDSGCSAVSENVEEAP